MNLKQRFKSFFKTKNATDATVELTRMFILPFVAKWNSRAPLEHAIGAFFSERHRKFYHANAKKSFKMPGHVFIAGNRTIQRFGNRDVAKGQYMLIVLDNKDKTAKVQIKILDKEREFLLTLPELEYLKDLVELKEA